MHPRLAFAYLWELGLFSFISFAVVFLLCLVERGEVVIRKVGCTHKKRKRPLIRETKTHQTTNVKLCSQSTVTISMVQTQTTIHNLLLYSTTIVVSNSQNDGNTCPLKCRNGSECKPGDASFEGHPTDVNGNELEHHTVTNVQNHHCECPIGYTGVDCSVVYESCADGSHVCYNQGSCVSGKVDGFGNEQYHCDCTNAFYREDKDLIIRFVGKYCEYPEETLCDDGKMFCVNNGVCATAGATSENTTCNCTSGFQGLHCEFREEEVPPCDLKCQNGGSCQVGLPPNANSDGAVDFQFCVCPPEHSGDLCEVWATNRQQYPTAMCAASDIETTIYQGFASLSFCVNDGVCTTIQEPDGRR